MTVEKFSSPGNRILGGIGALLGIAAIVAMAVNGPGRGELIAILAIGLLVTLCWTFMIRPQIRLTETALTLRNPLVTIDVPLQMVMKVEVRRYTLVDLAEERLSSPAVSRMLIQMARADRSGAQSPSGTPEPGFGDTAGFMTSRIKARMDERALVPLPDDAAVRRTPARLEMGLLAVSALGLVVALLV